MRHEWVVRFDYGRIRPWVRRETIDGERGDHRRRRPRQAGAARAPAAAWPATRRHVDEFDVDEGDELTFSTTWVPSHRRRPPPLGARRPDRRDDRRGRGAGPTRCTVRRALHADVVRRSLLTLRLLTHDEHRRHRRRARPPRCPRTSAASATGTTATAGCATPRSPSTSLLEAGYAEEARALARLAAARGRRRPRGPADHVRRRRRAGDLPERDARPPARVRRLAGRCGSATARSSSGRPTCSAR